MLNIIMNTWETPSHFEDNTSEVTGQTQTQSSNDELYFRGKQGLH